MNMLIISLYIIGFILLSGALAMVDAAFLSVTRAEVETMVQRELYGAKTLQVIKKNMTRAVIVVVILTNVVNVLGPIVVGYEAVEIFGSAIIGIITAVLTFGTIIFSEIIPKSIGSQKAPAISRIVAPFIQCCIWALFPVVILLEKITSLFHTGGRAVGTEDQIKSLVRLGRRAGFIRQDEDQLIQQTFLLNDKTAGDVMTEKEYMITIPSDSTIRGAADVVFRKHFSRYPVQDVKTGNVLGIVMSNDILQSISEGKDGQSIISIMRAVIFVENTTPCNELISIFRIRHSHMAVIEKENQTIGIITLEDVLEELVGDIEDEHDDVRKLSPKHSSSS